MKKTLTVHDILQKDCLEEIIARTLPEAMKSIWKPADTVIRRIIPNHNNTYLVKLHAGTTQYRNNDMALGYLIVPCNRDGLQYYKNLAEEKRAGITDDKNQNGLIDDYCKFLDNEEIFMVYFPFDFQLYEMPRVVDFKTVEQLIFGVPLQDTEYSVRECTLKLLGYRPEKRATFHFQWSYTDDREDLVFIGKMLHDFESAENKKEIGFMQSSHHRDRGKYGFAFPQAVASLPEIRSYVETADGDTSLHLLLETGDCEELLRNIGTRLAILHKSSLAPAREYAPGDELKLIRNWIALAQEYKPALTDILNHIADYLDRKTRSLTESDKRPVNGAVCGRNFVVTDSRIVALDWKSVCRAAPELDLASMKVYLEQRALDLKNSMNAFSDQWEVFLEAYRQEYGTIKNDNLVFYCLSKLLLEGLFLLFHPEREQHAETIINSCRTLME